MKFKLFSRSRHASAAAPAAPQAPAEPKPVEPRPAIDPRNQYNPYGNPWMIMGWPPMLVPWMTPPWPGLRLSASRRDHDEQTDDSDHDSLRRAA